MPQPKKSRRCVTHLESQKLHAGGAKEMSHMCRTFKVSAIRVFLLSDIRATICHDTIAAGEFHLSHPSHNMSSFNHRFYVTQLEDDFVRPYHTKRVHEAYAGKKQLMLMEGKHNGYEHSFTKV
eukprot:5753548-Pyramimonas_sp.AAC.2